MAKDYGEHYHQHVKELGEKRAARNAKYRIKGELEKLFNDIPDEKIHDERVSHDS